MQQIFSVIVLSSLAIIGFSQNNGAYNAARYNEFYNKGTQTTTVESGVAVYYADYLHGQSTAFGEIYNKNEFTASHSSYAKGTLLKVTRIDNGKSVIVRVNDKSTFSGDVVISLSFAAAMQIDLIKVGKSTVTIEVVGNSNLNPTNPNRDALVERELLAAKNSDKRYDEPIPLQSYDQLTPKGATGASFKWNAPSPKTEVAAGNVSPTNYDIPTTPRTMTMNSGYGIQIGSYGVYDNANRQLENLQNAGIVNAFVKESATSNGGRLFRVMVGSFASRTSAQDYLQSLRNQLIADGIVIDLSK